MANVNLVDDGFAEAGLDELTTVRKEMMNGFGTNVKSLQNFSTTFNKLTKAIEDLAKTHEQLTIAYNNFDKHKSSSSYKTKQEKEKLEHMEDSLDEALQLFDMGVKETYAKLTTFPDPRRTTRRIKKRMENVEEQLKQSGYMKDIVSYFMDFGRFPADFVESNFPNSGNLIEKSNTTPSLQIQRCRKDSDIGDVVQTDESAKNKGSLDFFTEYHIEVKAGSLLGLIFQTIKNIFSYTYIVDEVEEGSPLAKAVDPQLILNKEIICVNGKFVKNIDGDELEQLIRDICSVGGTISLGIIHEPFSNNDPLKVDVKEEPVEDKEVAVLQKQPETLLEYREIDYISDESFTASEDSDSASSDEEYCAIAARINASLAKDKKFPIKRSLSVGDLLAECRYQEPVVEYHMAEGQNSLWNNAAPEVEKRESMKADEVQNIYINLDKQLGTEDQNILSKAPESKYAKRLLTVSSSEESDSDSEDDKSSLDTEESSTDDEMPGLEQMDETDSDSRRMPSNSEEAARKLYLYNDSGTSSDISNYIKMMEEMLRQYKQIEAAEANKLEEPKTTPTTEPIVVQGIENSMPAAQLLTGTTEPVGLQEASQIVTEMKENLVAEKSAVNGSLDFFTEYHIEVEAGSRLGSTTNTFENEFSYTHIVDELKEGSPLAKAVDPQLILNKEIICVNRKFVKNIHENEVSKLIRDICRVGGTVSLGIIHEPFSNNKPIEVDVKEEPVQEKEAEESTVVTQEFTVVELLIILAVIVNIIVLLIL